MPSLYKIKANLKKSLVLQSEASRRTGAMYNSTEVIWQLLLCLFPLPVFWWRFISIISFISGELFIAQELKVLFKLARIIDGEAMSATADRSCLRDRAQLLCHRLEPHGTVQGGTANSDVEWRLHFPTYPSPLKTPWVSVQFKSQEGG